MTSAIADADTTAREAAGQALSHSTDSEVKPLWEPPDPENTPTFALLRTLNAKYSLNPPLVTYEDLWRFSVKRQSDFWGTVWDVVGVIGERGMHVVDEECVPADNPDWFADEETKLNWAENMCRWKDGEESKRTALIQVVEPLLGEQHDPKSLKRVTYEELYALVSELVSALLDVGLKPGDRVGAYCSNCIENVAACLATSAIGCIWVSAAADFGPEGVLERSFEQVKPKVVFSVNGVVYNGKVHPHLSKLSELLDGMASASCNPQKVVVINAVSSPPGNWRHEWEHWDNFVSRGRVKKLGRDEKGNILWKRMGFNWPLWILFSSGTTGRPKPIVHRAGGMLLQSLKEFVICGDLRPEDVFFYYTTTGWMMWNFLVSGLACGSTLVLYDGSPLREPAFLWHLVDQLGITIFGTSAKYIDQLSKVYKPREHHKLTALRHIYSTGSPLPASSFDYVYEHIHPDVLLGSVTGGTDICSLFAGMNTALPVYRGEIQCRMLGMAIETYGPGGTPSRSGEAGELVCVRPFPCQPAGFWPLAGFPDTDLNAVTAAAARHQAAYFSEYKNVWYHGDHVLLTPSRRGNGGGLVMLGRSDGVLNPGGVRFGSAEIYDVVDMCFKPGPTTPPKHVVVDCLAVGQAINGGADERVILFIKLHDGYTCTPELEKRIKTEIRARRTARHVPERIVQVSDVPYTLNGKRVEVPVKKIINGAPIAGINPATLRNPECLAEYAALGQKLRDELP
ncbi:acetoacetate-CoA ligase [Fomitiporia mediterranea MF3/22]|uniref:acetoacetate-CoA ligase n=1 Tax=Fomitiporia mediterranea (strain MF3/22) TaxID=694068 RepID=UPI00044086E9|nr:acetoacetate-CoA ligase [Fomitiporia mediterranea MF3/22]EJD01158.1 acetoacetate-CoA ligase [Fomitiporia mediterranea MF3/22]